MLKGFEETGSIPYGGTLERLSIDPGRTVPLTFVPDFPTYPPETAWSRQPETDIAGLILRESTAGALVAFMPADIDRRCAGESPGPWRPDRQRCTLDSQGKLSAPFPAAAWSITIYTNSAAGSFCTWSI